MATDEKNNDRPADTGDEGSTEASSCCSSGCGCGNLAGKGSTKLKIAICLVIALVIVGIFIFKSSSARQNPALGGNNGFSDSRKGPVTNSSGQQGGSAAQIAAIADLNSVADKLDTVFLIIPSKDNAPTTNSTGTILASAERTLNAKGLSTGIYTLQATSPDYPDVAAKVTPPGIAVLSKGRGIGFVSGGISESSLMQAYVASTRTGGCGPSGCPPPGGGQAAAPCN